MKKLIWLFIILILLVSSAQGEEPISYTYGNWKYTLLEDGTAEIIECLETNSTLRIPSQIDGHTVTSLGNYAFTYCIFSTSISIPDTVTSIKNDAFAFCYSLTSISIPNSVTSIGDRAFDACSSLNSISIPDSVTYIGNSAFAFCSSLSSITIPDSVTIMGDNPFQHCENLKIINISPDHPVLATIDGVLFCKPEKKLITYPCASNQPTYAVPQGIICIGNNAFSHCNSLISVDIPNSVSSIGNDAFSYCESLCSINIPNSVSSIGNDAFDGCSSLTSITVARNSYAAQWCKKQGLSHMYPDSLDWLKK